MERGYLSTVIVAVAVLIACTAIFNRFIDPYSLHEYDRLPRFETAQRPLLEFNLPDRGSGAVRRHVARSRAPLLLLGTSRTLLALPASTPVIDNAAIGGAALDEQAAVMRIASRRRHPPRLYIVEATPLLHHPSDSVMTDTADRIDTAIRAVSFQTTGLSLSLLRLHYRPHPLSYYAMLHPMAGRPDHEELIDHSANDRRATLAVILQSMIASCSSSGATLLIYEPPQPPEYLSDALTRKATTARVSMYHQALTRNVKNTRCHASIIDISGVDPAGQVHPAINRDHWIDRLHYDSVVGLAVYDTLIKHHGS